MQEQHDARRKLKDILELARSSETSTEDVLALAKHPSPQVRWEVA